MQGPHFEKSTLRVRPRVLEDVLGGPRSAFESATGLELALVVSFRRLISED